MTNVLTSEGDLLKKTETVHQNTGSTRKLESMRMQLHLPMKYVISLRHNHNQAFQSGISMRRMITETPRISDIHLSLSCGSNVIFRVNMLVFDTFLPLSNIVGKRLPSKDGVKFEGDGTRAAS